MPTSEEEASQLARQARKNLEQLPHGKERLRRRKQLAELNAFYRNAAKVYAGTSSLTREEVANRRAPVTVSHSAFGRVHLPNFPGVLYSTVTRGRESQVGDPTVVASFADGVTGYLMPEDDLAQGGYESTWALFTPESVRGLSTVALELIRPRQKASRSR